MAKENKKQMVEGVVDLDTSRLFDDLDRVISYLREVKAEHPDKVLHLDEHWYGYEDNEHRFVYSRLETDEEFNQRIEIEEANAKRIAENIAREKIKNQKLKQLEQLKRELGIR